MLMLLGISNKMNLTEREVITRSIIQGFNEAAKEAETLVTGGQTVYNPWPIIGGVAISVCKTPEFVVPINAKPGDVVVLTKPLGTQVAVNVYQWMHQPERWAKVEPLLSKEQGAEAYLKACESMGRLNRNAARLMIKYGAHCGTDVTGFGILGHAQNLANVQTEDVTIRLHTLPCIQHMTLINDNVLNFRLTLGYSAETSGAILVCLPPDAAEAFVREIQEIDGQPAWIIGDVVAGGRTAEILSNVNILEI
eukprot:GILI01007354.1.p1 GENE.GILI01007354.1~~GILI01007354.1.p1  ORF type:complete len:251 (-),score=76.57 GILI01007354.1:445-1197(-)